DWTVSRRVLRTTAASRGTISSGPSRLVDRRTAVARPSEAEAALAIMAAPAEATSTSSTRRRSAMARITEVETRFTRAKQPTAASAASQADGSPGRWAGTCENTAMATLDAPAVAATLNSTLSRDWRAVAHDSASPSTAANTTV